MTKNKDSSTAKIIIIFVVIFFSIGLYLLYINYDRDNYSEFEKVGYYKNDKIRIMSYYSSTKDFAKIKKHARSIPWVKGGVTQIYYFDDRENTPNVTHLGVKFGPRFKKCCIAAYHKLTDGEEKFAKYPFKD